MDHPLIATKLHIPKPRRDLVERGRLSDLIDRGSEARLVLVSAPAGFGKTTLLTDWIARSPGAAIAWLSLDPSDNDPSLFWPHVVAALRGAVAGADAAFSAAPATGAPPDPAFLATLANDIAAFAGSLTLVLDDFHVIDHAEIQAGLGFLIDHLPAQARIAISTRADPDLPLGRLRARGDLVEIRAADLRFTADEAASYLNGVMGLGLAAGDVATMEARTEGWIAALQLAVLSLRGRTDASAFVAEFAGSGRYIVDYLVEEVLERQPEDVRHFLLSTAMLGRLSGPLCDTVTGLEETGRAMLHRLERQNLFLVPLDDRRQWYRYHHLFADVLLSHLRPDERRALPARHLRASQWFEANGERPEAIRHALAAEAFEWAAELIERAVPEMRRNRQEALFRAWMRSIPQAVVGTRPVLGIAYVGVLLSLGELEGLQDRLRAAELQLPQLADPGNGPASIALYRSALAQVRGDLPAALAQAERVLELAPPDEHLTRAGAAGFLGIVHWSRGELDAAVTAWTACRDGLGRAGHLADVLGTTNALADILTTQGRLSEAFRVCEKALALAEAGGQPALRGTADVHASLALLTIARSDLSAARRHVERSVELGERFGLPQHPWRSKVAGARLAAAEGELLAALDRLGEAERVFVSDFFPNVRPIAAMKARLCIRLGRLDEAARWRREAAVTADEAPSFLREYEQITLARLKLAEAGDDGAALTSVLGLLTRLGEAAAAGGRVGSRIEIHLLAALAQRLRNDPAAALAELGAGLELAAPEGQARLFLDEGEPMTGLLKLACKRGTTPAYARQLVALAGAGNIGRPSEQPASVEALSAREIEVLRLLRGDLSGPEMARELAVSLNTVRTHIKNIYDKLAVNSRRAAVRRAEELKLLARR